MEEEENVVSYETFRKFHRKEKRNKRLQELPKEFYQACQDWLKRKRRTFEKSRGDTTSLYEIDNVKRIIKDIYDRREKKILLMALHTVRSGATPENLLPEERKFYDKAVSLLKDSREDLLKKVTEEEREEAKSGEEVEEEEIYNENEEKEEGEEENEKIEKKAEKEKIKSNETEIKVKDNFRLVKVLEETPKFMGTDLKPYGPLDQGDLVTLPKDVAELLEKKDKVKTVKLN